MKQAHYGLQTIVFVFLLLFCHVAYASSQPVTTISTYTQPATAISYVGTDGNTYSWGTGAEVILDTFSTASGTYSAAAVADSVIVRRVDNAVVSGNRCTLFAERSSTSRTLPPSLSCDPASIMSGRVVNRGWLDVFNNQSRNNIERVDFIFSNGIQAPSTVASLENSGFIVTEKSGNNPTVIAAITALDSAGNPSSYTPLVKVWPASSGQTIRYGLSGLSFDFTFLQDGTTPATQDSNPLQIGTSTEQMGIGFITLDDFGITTNQMIYGFSYFSQDIYDDTQANNTATGINLVDYTTYPTNTSGAGDVADADMYGGVSGYFTTAQNISGTAFHDQNTNGALDGNEARLSNITIRLYTDTNNNGLIDTGENIVATTSTNINGDYSFNVGANTNYLIQADETDPDTPPSFSTSTNPISVNMASTNINNLNFPYTNSLTAAQVCSEGTQLFADDFGTGGPKTSPDVLNHGYVTNNPGDGFYTVINPRDLTAGYFGGGNLDDHTPGDTDGSVLAINMLNAPNVFYRKNASGITPNSLVSFQAWINGTCTGCADRGQIEFIVEDAGGNILYRSGSPGDAVPNDQQWYKRDFVFNVGSNTSFNVVLRNDAASGSNGNDILIDDIAICQLTRDYGDAPVTGTAPAGGAATNNYGEAAHDVSGSAGNIYLGTTPPDLDNFGNQPDADALGDNNNGNNDEDGIATSALTLTAGSNNFSIAATDITANSTGTLHAWVDFDGNGTFDADEHSSTSVSAGIVAAALNWTLDGTGGNPDFTLTGGTTTFARFRLTSDTSINASTPASIANDGEVEDYALTIQPSGIVVSGRVYNDDNADGMNDAAELGISNLPVVLYDTINGTCVSTRTDGGGNYRFTGVLPSTYQVYEASRETVPTPQSCDPAQARDPSGYLSTTDSVSTTLPVINTDVTGINFGNALLPNFAPDNASTVLPGNITFYPHVFTAPTTGSVLFSLVADAPTSWSSLMYHDSDCDGDLSTAEASTNLSAPLATVAGTDLCILHKVFAPSSAAAGQQSIVTITADFMYGDGSTQAANQVLRNEDITTVTSNPVSGEGKLELIKTVENLTQGTPETESQNTASPGDTLQYRIYYRNTGTAPLDTLTVNDTVPAFTLLDAGNTLCDTTPVTLSCVPDAANDPEIVWNFTGQLEAGEQGSVSYRVIVE